MKDRIVRILPHHQLMLYNGSELFIADYKDLNNGDVVMLEQAPNDINYVHITNSREVDICFDGFKDNALPLEVGCCNPQCECVLFPNQCDSKDWILFVETKYANDYKTAFNTVYDYPNGMVRQIIETVRYFRDKGIIEERRKVHAIVSFPNLIGDFNSTLFHKAELSVEEILLQHKIIVRGVNSAQVISEKRIKLLSQ